MGNSSFSNSCYVYSLSLIQAIWFSVNVVSVFSESLITTLMLKIYGFSLVQSCASLVLLVIINCWNSLCLCWSSGAQSQLVCSGCRNLLLYPVGATSVCCAVCNAVTGVPPPGMFLSIYPCFMYMYISIESSI